MKGNFALACIMAMTHADDRIMDPYHALDIMMNDEPHTVYIAQNYWT